MTGSGAIEDPYIIYDVGDLQAMEDHLDAYYELANNVDASGTAGWNAGLGFMPIGYYPKLFTRRPISDIHRTDEWTSTPPVPPGHLYENVDEEVADDTDYITENWPCVTVPHEVVLGILPFNVPADATNIWVRVYIRGEGFWNPVKALLDIGGVYHEISTWKTFLSGPWTTKNWPSNYNPATGAAWTPSEVNSIQGIGIRVGQTFANPYVSFSQVYVTVQYTNNFRGSFDGKNHTIDGLHINRGLSGLGLFGNAVGATLQDVILTNVNIAQSGDTQDCVAGLVGYAENTNISNCHVGGYITLEGRYNDYIGMLCGDYYGDGTVGIVDCSSSGIIHAGAAAHANWCYGGLVGGAYIGDITISGCRSSVTLDTPLAFEAGGLIGYVYNDGVFQILDSYATGDVLCDKQAGGLIGWFEGGTITNCYATGKVGILDSNTIGGFIGCVCRAPFTIARCYSTGDVTGEYVLGGFIGDADYSGEISQCFSTGDVSASRVGWCGVGGFIGTTGAAFVLSDCYSRGNVVLVANSETAGGFIGELYLAVLSNCYSTGAVTGGIAEIGGFIGRDWGNGVTACFWDIETSGMDVSDGGTGKSTVAMKHKPTFTGAGWDFAAIWTICSGVNDDYPCLVDLTPACVYVLPPPQPPQPPLEEQSLVQQELLELLR